MIDVISPNMFCIDLNKSFIFILQTWVVQSVGHETWVVQCMSHDLKFFGPRKRPEMQPATKNAVA